MRRLMAVVVAGLIGIAGPAFAQDAPPVLIGQNTPVSASASPGGDDALAQVPDDDGLGGIFNNPLLIAGIITAAIAVPLALALSNNDTDATTSP